MSLRLRPDPAVERKLRESPGAGRPRSAHHPGSDRPPRARAAAPGAGTFRLRYDGGVNEPLGASALARSDRRLRRVRQPARLPPEMPTIDVTLQAGQVGPGPAGAGVGGGLERRRHHPGPGAGTRQADPAFVRVLRHELAHSFVTVAHGQQLPDLAPGGHRAVAGGRRPRAARTRASPPLARAGQLSRLLTLEGPFQNLSEAEAPLAYAASLSAVAHILRKRGRGRGGAAALRPRRPAPLGGGAARGPGPQLSRVPEELDRST